jgi:probable rRNA maturation factor
LASVGLPKWQIEVEFLAPGSMQRLNRDFRQKDKPTDVLSFPQQNWKKPARIGRKAQPIQPTGFGWQHLGDIAICPQVAAQNATLLDHGIDRETGFLLVHGILHLCGHDHLKPKDEKIMLAEQRKIMGILTPAKGQPLWKNCIQRKRSK